MSRSFFCKSACSTANLFRRVVITGLVEMNRYRYYGGNSAVRANRDGVQGGSSIAPFRV